eukprot:m.247201 g.247201  ORF g.247201 m.247201 type:complete len:555 (-) comp15323_c0_seq1:153-1817(-)
MVLSAVWALLPKAWDWRPLARRIAMVALYIALFFVVLHLILGSAVVLYSAFYYFYVPVALHTYPIYFDFSGVRPFTYFPLSPNEGPLFAGNQGYNIDLILTLPQSPSNKDVGMFSVDLLLASTRERAMELAVAASAIPVSQGFDLRLPIRRPVMLHFRSRVLNGLRTLLFSGAIILGLMEETETVHVRLAHNVFDNRTEPYTWAAVALSDRSLQVYDAELQFHAHMTGLTYLMFHYFFSSFAIGVLCIAGAISAMVLSGAILFMVFKPRLVRAPTPIVELRTPSPAMRAAAGLVYDAALDMYVLPPPTTPPAGRADRGPPSAFRAVGPRRHHDDHVDRDGLPHDPRPDGSPRDGPPRPRDGSPPPRPRDPHPDGSPRGAHPARADDVDPRDDSPDSSPGASPIPPQRHAPHGGVRLRVDAIDDPDEPKRKAAAQARAAAATEAGGAAGELGASAPPLKAAAGPDDSSSRANPRSPRRGRGRPGRAVLASVEEDAGADVPDHDDQDADVSANVTSMAPSGDESDTAAAPADQVAPQGGTRSSLSRRRSGVAAPHE